MGKTYKTKVNGGYRVNKNIPGIKNEMCKGLEVEKGMSGSRNWRNSGVVVYRDCLCQRKGALMAAGTMRSRPFLVRT